VFTGLVSNCLWRNTHKNVFILNLKAARSKKPDGYKIQMLYRMVGSFSHQRSQVQLNYIVVKPRLSKLQLIQT